MNETYKVKALAEKLTQTRNLSDGELAFLLETKEDTEPLRAAAEAVRREVYGTDVYIRGLIEVSNYCKNNCYYCGIRAGNTCVERYRLSREDILSCCETGYGLGFRTFVLQGGEDPLFTDKEIAETVAAIRKAYPDCAITLSLGEKSKEAYRAFFEAGANRYLLRHETATRAHYQKLHPKELTLENRKRCLYDLKEIGYQVGAGFMVGSPYQETAHLLADLRFLQELAPDMVGIGPYLTHKQTPFRDFPNGSFETTLRLISLVRLMHPSVLLPATTALGTICQGGREKGILSGANVVMPNLSPKTVRKNYALYENKLSDGEECGEGLEALKKSVAKIGYRIVTDRGDRKKE